jgi:hypothetical protein
MADALPLLDRRVPTDWKHVDKHPLRTARRPELDVTPSVVEKVLNIPRNYRDLYNQGAEGACVGFSQSWGMSILNRKQYDARKLYHEAQKIDEWDDTPPGQGTSLRAGFDVLRTIGHWRVYASKTREPKLVEGIESNKWATTVDEIRACILNDLPVNTGVNWYREFSEPKQKPRLGDDGEEVIEFGFKRSDYWVAPENGIWGPVDGGHAIEIVGASDRREAFAWCNTWGYGYPFIVWVPYRSLERLLRENGEAGIVVDRPKAA